MKHAPLRLATMDRVSPRLLACLATQQREIHGIEVVDRHLAVQALRLVPGLGSLERLGQLVGDLLELSRIEGGRLALEPEPIEVGSRVARVVEDLAVRSRAKDLRITAAQTGPTWACADPMAFEQVLLNLLDNAIAYTEPGGEIEIEIAERRGRVEIAVRDTGLGIPEADLARIFERFYRVDKARSRDSGGTGLGLAIVKHLVQAMDGTITVESELGRGSCFRVTLPAASAPASAGSPLRAAPNR